MRSRTESGAPEQQPSCEKDFLSHADLPLFGGGSVADSCRHLPYTDYGSELLEREHITMCQKTLESEDFRRTDHDKMVTAMRA